MLYLYLNPPTTPKGCRCYAGMVNLLSMFCPKLQKLLKPIYDLTRKGRNFIWGKEQQEGFEEIKRMLTKAPVLHMPNCKRNISHYIWIQVNLQQVVHYIGFKMKSQN